MYGKVAEEQGDLPEVAVEYIRVWPWHASTLPTVLSEKVRRLDMCNTCKYAVHMSRMIQLRNVPDGLHRTLKAQAALAGMSLSDYLLAEVRRLAERPTVEQLRERLRRRSSVTGGESAAEAVRRERDGR